MSGGARGRPPAPPDPAGSPDAGPQSGTDRKLSLQHNPLLLACSPVPWRAAWYLLAYLLLGWLLFSVAFTVAATSAVFAITLAGIPLAVGAGAAIRGCAEIERRRLHLVFDTPVRGAYRDPGEHGMLKRFSIRWHDPATWRDLAYLVGLWLPFTFLDTIVISFWVTFLAGITVPIWYRFPEQTFNHGQSAHGLAFGYFPNGPHGHGAVGWFVDTLPGALLAAAVFLVLFLIFNYVLIITARAQARTARALLRPHADPLAPARNVLAAPGPLQPLTSGSAVGADSASPPVR